MDEPLARKPSKCGAVSLEGHRCQRTEGHRLDGIGHHYSDDRISVAWGWEPKDGPPDWENDPLLTIDQVRERVLGE